MRRTVMDLPSMTSSISRKSCFCSFSSSLKAAWRSSDSGAERIARSTSGRRSPRNMCSVRHRPMPSAPKAMARVESRGVSALARTCRRRTLSAWAQELVDGLDELAGALHPRRRRRGRPRGRRRR